MAAALSHPSRRLWACHLEAGPAGGGWTDGRAGLLDLTSLDPWFQRCGSDSRTAPSWAHRGGWDGPLSAQPPWAVGSPAEPSCVPTGTQLFPLLPEEGPCPKAGALSLGPQHGGRGPAGNRGPGLEPAGGGRGPVGCSTSQPPGPPVLGSGAASHPPSRHPVFSGAAPHKEPWDDAGPPGTQEGPHLTCFP